jgi:hypothetical protein
MEMEEDSFCKVRRSNLQEGRIPMNNTYSVTYIDQTGNLFVDEGIKNVFEFLDHISNLGSTLVSVQVTA